MGWEGGRVTGRGGEERGRGSRDGGEEGGGVEREEA